MAVGFCVKQRAASSPLCQGLKTGDLANTGSLLFSGRHAACREFSFSLPQGFTPGATKECGGEHKGMEMRIYSI